MNRGRFFIWVLGQRSRAVVKHSENENAGHNFDLHSLKDSIEGSTSPPPSSSEPRHRSLPDLL